MKIALYLAYTLGSAGGNQRMLLEIASRLDKKGHDITVISGDDPPCDMARQYDLNYKPIKYIHGEKLTFIDNALKFFQPKSGILNNPTAKVIEALSFFWNSKKVIIKEKYDAIILFKSIDALLFKEIKKKCPQTRLYVYIGGPYIMPLHLEKKSVEHLDYVIGLSYAVSKDTEKKTGIKCMTIHSGTDFKIFNKDDSLRKEYRKKYNLNDKFALMSVARLVEWKGIQVAVKALKELVKKNENIKYIIVGEGPYEIEIDRLIEELNLKEHVIRIPKHTQQELVGLYNGSDIYLQPSIGFEGLGITVVEAMACGLPVIGSRIGGIPEMINDKKNGFLTIPGDVLELVKKIEFFLKDKARIKKFSDEALKIKYSDFNWQKTADSFEALLANSLKKKS
ncbi:MAG: glycosyltransferase family 4 protein [archaeon]